MLIRWRALICLPHFDLAHAQGLGLCVFVLVADVTVQDGTDRGIQTGQRLGIKRSWVILGEWNHIRGTVRDSECC